MIAPTQKRTQNVWASDLSDRKIYITIGALIQRKKFGSDRSGHLMESAPGKRASFQDQTVSRDTECA
jgi:hypothetical protein